MTVYEKRLLTTLPCDALFVLLSLPLVLLDAPIAVAGVLTSRFVGSLAGA